MISVQSPNENIRPASAAVNSEDHLVIGGVDTVVLAQEFGTPLWVIDEHTVLEAINAYKKGLESYPDSRIMYAGKAFLCLAMCHILKREKLGLDVVSSGELYTAIKANFPAEQIFMHGNNKSRSEVEEGLRYGDLRIVVDGDSELEMVADVAKTIGKKAKILLRIIPGVEPDTHHHIVTGHHDSKFGVPLEELHRMVAKAQSMHPHIELRGLHAHIGSQAKEIEPYLEQIEILADTLSQLKRELNVEFPDLDIGGGLGISYIEADKPISIFEWTRAIAHSVATTMKKHGLALPHLSVEPGRSIIGTAGITLYRAGHKKELPSGISYISVDGGMADNPRPITYDAKYTAAVANRMSAAARELPITLAGKFCESGDIIIKETFLPAETGDLIAVFGTGAYNYSMASNYNRTGRPACVLVNAGRAELIIERESHEDLLSKDRVPERLRQ